MASLDGEPYLPAAQALRDYQWQDADRWLFLKRQCPLLSAWIEQEATAEAERIEAFLAAGAGRAPSRKPPTPVLLAAPHARIDLIDLCTPEELALLEAAKRLEEREQSLVTAAAYGGGEAAFWPALRRSYPVLAGQLDGCSSAVEAEALGELRWQAEQSAAPHPLQAPADCWDADCHAFAATGRRYPRFFAHCLEPAAGTEVEIAAFKGLERTAYDRNTRPQTILLDIYRRQQNGLHGGDPAAGPERRSVWRDNPDHL